jgi:hypothetical protein
MTQAIGAMYGSRDRSRHLAALIGRGFDRRQKAKAANDAPAGEGDGEDMFSRAGVAAE